MKTKLSILFAFFLLTLSSAAQTDNERQARKLFNSIYDKVYGSEGATLHYAVNIYGLYKTEGTVWYKGKKSKFVDERYDAYSDGVSYWRAERKKKEVLIYSMNDDSRDKYASKFKFEPNNYRYSLSHDDKGYWITLDAKKGVKGIKQAIVQLHPQNKHPLTIRIKVGVFHTTIQISNFKTGGISDDIFVFNKHRYADYTVVDKRKKS